MINNHNDLEHAIGIRNAAQDEFNNKLRNIPLYIAISSWIQNINTSCKDKYATYMDDLIKRGIIPTIMSDGSHFTIGSFADYNHLLIYKKIRNIDNIPRDLAKDMIDSHSSLMRYIQTLTKVHLREKQPSRVKSVSRNIEKILSFSVSRNIEKILSFDEWYKFIISLRKVNEGYYLYCLCIIPFNLGRLRLSETRELRIYQVDFDNFTVRFGKDYITYTPRFMQDLREYIIKTSSLRKNSELVFITKRGREIGRSQPSAYFHKASKESGILKMCNTDSLRFTWQALRTQGYSIKDILDAHYKA